MAHTPTTEEQQNYDERSAEQQAGWEEAHPDVDHRPTTIRKLDVSGSFMEQIIEASDEQKAAIVDFLKLVNEQDKQRAIRWSMEKSSQTKRIARLWKDQRDRVRELERELAQVVIELEEAEYQIGKAQVKRQLQPNGGILRRFFHWLKIY